MSQRAQTPDSSASSSSSRTPSPTSSPPSSPSPSASPEIETSQQLQEPSTAIRQQLGPRLQDLIRQNLQAGNGTGTNQLLQNAGNLLHRLRDMSHDFLDKAAAWLTKKGHDILEALKQPGKSCVEE